MIRRPPRSTRVRSSAASDVYKRQAMDKRGRLFVCDRANTRIQIFDQDGKHLATWHQFGMPSGIAFSTNDEDLIYVYDSESDNVENPGFEQGIRIGDALR